MNLKNNYANKSNYGGTRSLDTIKYIVVHYTGNDGDTDENNANYFKNNVVKTSAHYFVDDDSVTQSVPDQHIAWHCGASKYRHSVCRNANSIGVEICDDIKNGVIYPSTKTIANVLELVEYLMKKYNIPKANVIRHWDVTGKMCPDYWCGTTANDKKWKTEFWDKLNAAQTEVKSGNEVAQGKNETSVKSESGVSYCAQAGAFSLKKYATAKCDAIKAAGFNAILVQIGAQWKVHVAPFGSRADAEKTATKLKAAGFSALVVKAISNPAVETIGHGSTVRVKKGAKTYDGTSLATFVYNRDHTVKSIAGDRVVITYNDIVIAAIRKEDLILV